MESKETTTKFEAGRVYAGTFICDSDLTVFYRVISRTAKMVTVQQVAVNNTALTNQPVLRRGVKSWNGVEVFMPDGNYSMALSIHADRARAEAVAA